MAFEQGLYCCAWARFVRIGDRGEELQGYWIGKSKEAPSESFARGIHVEQGRQQLLLELHVESVASVTELSQRWLATMR